MLGQTILRLTKCSITSYPKYIQQTLLLVNLNWYFFFFFELGLREPRLASNSQSCLNLLSAGTSKNMLSLSTPFQPESLNTCVIVKTIIWGLGNSSVREMLCQRSVCQKHKALSSKPRAMGKC